VTPERIDNAADFPPFTVPATWYAAHEARAVVLLLPALGTPAAYYQAFAEALNAAGYSVLSPELPGTGASLPRPARGVDYGYLDLVERYLPPLAALARDRAPGLPLLLAGHSLGAQIEALALLRGGVRADALLAIASCHIHYRNWDGVDRFKVYSAALLATLLAASLGFFPGRRLGFGGPQPAHLMRDWSATIRGGRFPGQTRPQSQPGMPPALALAYEGDFMSPPRAAAELAAMVGGETQVLNRSWPGSAHFSWCRHPGPTVAAIERWLRQHGIGQA